jgi:3-phenylpropionate/cinnamic acid dioxygenase small subunit
MTTDRHRLADRQEICDLLIEYCRALDLMDLPAIARVFTEDCEVEYGPEDRLRSRGSSGVAKSLERMWRWARTSHHLSNIQIAFEGEDRARSVSYVLAWHERPDGSTATVMGQYHDELVRGKNGWRIARRRMEMNGSDAGFTVNLHRTRRQKPPAGWVAPNIDRPLDIEGPATGRK